MTSLRRPRSRSVLAIAAAGALLGWLVSRGVSADATTSEETTTKISADALGDDVQDLVYLGPLRPIIIRLHLRIDGRPLSESRRTAARQLFDALDTDNNGVLEGKELGGIPSAALLDAASRRPSKAADARSSDQPLARGAKITPEALIAALEPYLGSFFSLSVSSPAAAMGERSAPAFNGYAEAQTLDMRSFLAIFDADGDGRVTTAECSRVDDLFRLLDLNDDETISRTEIAEVVAAKNAGGAADSTPLGDVATRLLPIDRGGPRTEIARKLLERYGRTLRDWKTGHEVRQRTLTTVELGLAPDALARFDKNNDGRLDEKETVGWLSDPTPEFELDVAVPRKSLQQPRVVVRRGSNANDAEPESIKTVSIKPVTIKSGAEGTVLLRIGQIPIELHAAETPPRPVSRTGYRKAIFKRADRDNNNYLDAGELATADIGVSLGPADFKAIDRNHNNMIHEDEWLAFMELYETLAEYRVTLTVTASVNDPISQFDANGDGRLTRGELAHMLETFRGWDVNHDDKISADEIPQHFDGLFHLGTLRKVLRRRGMQRMAPVVAAPSTAPSWFQKMDRNRDGEVSLREFLGPLSVFRRLDANHDGYLDAAESKAAANVGE